MKLSDEQLGQVWDQLVIHKNLGNYDAMNVWGCWINSRFNEAYAFINHELSLPHCHPYLTQLVSEMVTDRISK